MSTLQQLKENFGQTWEGLTSGWRHLMERASGALTRFTSPRPGKKDESGELVTQGARWGLMAAEVLDEDKQIIVRLEAPGMRTDDFEISVHNDVLVVRGEKKYRREQDKGHYYLLECAYGHFERALPLPATVDEDKAEASYKRGVLTITLQKKGGASRKRITVQDS